MEGTALFTVSVRSLELVQLPRLLPRDLEAPVAPLVGRVLRVADHEASYRETPRGNPSFPQKRR